MRYFNDLGQQRLEEMFSIPPAKDLGRLTKERLSYAVGALLYMSASSPKILNSLVSKKIPFLVSAAICLEDAVRDNDVLAAEKNVLAVLEKLYHQKLQGESLPFIFIRVRDFEQMQKITQHIDWMEVLTGFILPKFSQEKGGKYFPYLQELNQKTGHTLYAMPILETLSVNHPEHGLNNLLAIKKFLDGYRHLVLNVRLGITDLSGIYALRRGISQTCYDLAVIQNFIASAVNVFARQDAGYVVSGPVWEYYHAKNKHAPPNVKWLRGLLRETKLDRANGLTGKTVIHPSQLLPVQAVYAVTAEEYADAADILDGGEDGGGVIKSLFTAKMNEMKPHANWAQKIMMLAEIYGVLHEEYDYRGLIKRGLEV